MHQLSTRSTRVFCGALLAAALPAALAAQGRLLDLPADTWTAHAVSDDGTVVSGEGSNGVFRWTEAGGVQYLGIPASLTDLSGDGSVVMGNLPETMTLSGQAEGALWTPTAGWTNIFGLPGSSCFGSSSIAYAMSKDGRAIVGLGWMGCDGAPIRWSAATNVINLGVFGLTGRANAISGDGAVVGGWDAERDEPRRAAVWFPSGTTYNEILIIPRTPANPNGLGEVFGMNHTGSVIVGGESAGQAWRWKNGVFQSLGIYAGAQSGDQGTARATNADGSMIVGVSGSPMNGFGPFIWTEQDGMHKLINFVASQGIAIPSGPALTWAFDISPSGYHIVGRRGSAGGFLVELPAGVRYGMYHRGNNTMRLSGTGSTAVGDTVTVTTDNVANSLPVITLIGTRSTKVPLLGGTLLVDPTPPFVALRNVSSAGSSSFNLPIPNDPTIAGASLFLQSAVVDTSAGKVTLSNGIKLTLTD